MKLYRCIYAIFISQHLALHVKLEDSRIGRPAFICIILPQTSIPSSNIYHPDVAEPIVQMFLLEYIVQLVASYFRVTNLCIDVGV